MTMLAKMTIEHEPSGIADLPAALDLAAFEHVHDALFRPVGALPAWLHLPGANAAAERKVDLCDLYPLLELFLPELEPVWVSLIHI